MSLCVSVLMILLLNYSKIATDASLNNNIVFPQAIIVLPTTRISPYLNTWYIPIVKHQQVINMAPLQQQKIIIQTHTHNKSRKAGIKRRNIPGNSPNALPYLSAALLNPRPVQHVCATRHGHTNNKILLV